MTQTAPRVAVVQDGARLHYALPLALQRQGMLQAMYTDWFVKPGSTEATLAATMRRFVPGLGSRLAGRRCQELSADHVVSSPLIALRAGLDRLHPDTAEQREARVSRWMGAWIAREGWRGANCVMGFARSIHPSLLASAKADGLATIVDQIIAPASIEHEALASQAERWPSWAIAMPASASEVALLESQTWSETDRITCPSDYVRDGLIACGIEPRRISVLPYPIDTAAWEVPDRSQRTGPVTIGFVGAVGLRKGAPVVFELARRFDPARVRFVMVGPITAPAERVAESGNVVLTGAIPRSAMQDRYREFDIFLLPSACEGSPGAIMEAMAAGLPIITTPTAGSVIIDGREGFIRPCHDLDGLSECIARLVDTPPLRRSMGQAARLRAEQYDIDAYGRSLRTMLAGRLP
jgi:glycosyltransferase involved in cell wall biosynthesis